MFSHNIEMMVTADAKEQKNEIINATSISSSQLNKNIEAYENKQKAIAKAKQDIQKARQNAIEEARLAKQRAIEKKNQLEKQKELERQKAIEQKKKAEKQKELAKQKAIEKQKQQELEKEKAEKQKELEKQQAAQAKKDAEKQRKAQAAKRRSASQRAVASYISEYQNMVGMNWIKDECRGIYDLPKATIRNGRFIKLNGSSGNFRCDRSLVQAIKKTTAPKIDNLDARKIIESENVSFVFKQ